MIDTKSLVKELQEMREDGYLTDALLRFSVRSLKEGDERCDWVAAYLFNASENELWLHNYVGPRTEISKIPAGEGAAGKAVAQKDHVNLPHVEEEEGYEPPAPNASSEMVVVIKAGDEVFGVLDVSSMEPEAFEDEDVAALSMVAEKLAEQLVAERR